MAGFLALAFANDVLPAPFPAAQRALMGGSIPRAATLLSGTVVYGALVSAGVRPNFYRRLALQMWVSRNWTGPEALAAWAETSGVTERARSLYGKDLLALDAAELAGLVSFLRAPSGMRQHPATWLAARKDLLQRMADAGLITQSARAAADGLPLPAPRLTAPKSAPVDEH